MPRYPSRVRHPRQPRRDDRIIIAVMGETGAGKSEYVGRVTGKDAPVNHTLTSVRDISTYDFRLPSVDGRSICNITLIDCPGFDDVSMPDRDIINSILEYLKANYQNDQKLHGIIYMMPITRTRMTNRGLANLMIFRELCGEDYYGNVVLATTHWDQLADEATGERTEQELRNTPDFWGKMVDRHSRVVRIRRDNRYGTRARNVASENDLSIIRSIADKHPKWLRAQTEMAGGLAASATSAMAEQSYWESRLLQVVEDRQPREPQDDQARLRQVRRRFRREVDQHITRRQNEREQLKAVMDQELQQHELQLAQDRAHIRDRERDIHQRQQENARNNHGPHPRTSAASIRRLEQLKRDIEPQVREQERRELQDLMRNCRLHKRSGSSVTDFLCSGKTCENRINVETDHYYRKCDPSRMELSST